ncbi:MAG: cell division ATP-binding protein FtsE [Selenomonadaceae bacterium]|nr:cell division ATP-binding protein FtsE [Selenomonadaceae bacterium]
MIHLANVTKIYEQNNVVALDNISLDINEGEFVFIVGASGSGKSTLIKLLMHEELATSGEIVVDGRDVVNLKPKEVPYLRRSLGVVFQDYRLLEDKTVYENVAFAMQVIEAPRRLMQRTVNTVLDIVGLSDKFKHFPDQLSGGEQQRVAIARAIVNDPRIVIADEPTGNLDPETSWDIMDIFRRINAAGTTIVMATHDKVIVDRMKKRVVALVEGKIVRDELRGTYERK